MEFQSRNEKPCIALLRCFFSAKTFDVEVMLTMFALPPRMNRSLMLVISVKLKSWEPFSVEDSWVGFEKAYSLKLTFSHLKIDGWKMAFLFGSPPICFGWQTVSFRDCIPYWNELLLVTRMWSFRISSMWFCIAVSPTCYQPISHNFLMTCLNQLEISPETHHPKAILMGVV